MRWITSLPAAALGFLALLVGCSDPQHASSSSPATRASVTTGPADSAADLSDHWTGDATVIVQWANQKQLLLDLTITRDGAVTGTVGDARLVNAHLKKSRGDIERSLGWGRDWRIHGQLDGDLIHAEQIHRDGVDIVFNVRDDGVLVGGVNSSGSKFGGKESMILSAGNMRLRRVASTRPAG